ATRRETGETEQIPRRRPMRALALAALLLALAALAAFLLSTHSKQQRIAQTDGDIGVPIGVPATPGTVASTASPVGIANTAASPGVQITSTTPLPNTSSVPPGESVQSYNPSAGNQNAIASTS